MKAHLPRFTDAQARVPETRAAIQTRRKREFRLYFAIGAALSVTSGLLAPKLGLVALGLLIASVYAPRIDLPATLGIYAAALMVVPSRYTVGSFAVTASMLVALVATVQLLFTTLTVRRRSQVVGAETQAQYVSPPVVTAMLAFGAAMLLSYVVSHLSYLSPLAASSADSDIAGLLAALAVAIACTLGLRSRRQVEVIVWALVIGAAIAAIIGVLQFTAGISIENALRPPGFTLEAGSRFIASRAGFRRIAGTARNPIEMGVSLAAVLPWALYLAMHATTHRSRRIAAICTLLLVVALPLALSRSGLLAAAVAVTVSAVGWTWSQRLKALWLVAMALVILPTIVPNLFDALLGLFNGKVGSASVATRTANGEQLLHLASKSLWFGHGFGTFNNATLFDVSNTYVELLYEVGIVGVIAFVLLVGSCLARAIAVRQNAVAQGDRALALALIASVLAICVGGWGLNLFRFPMMEGALFLSFGLIGALTRQIDAPVAAHSP